MSAVSCSVSLFSYLPQFPSHACPGSLDSLTSTFYNLYSNSQEIKSRFLLSIATGCPQVLPKVGFVFVFRFEKTYLKLKDCNFLCKDKAPCLQEMCVYTGIQMGFKMLKEVDVIY